MATLSLKELKEENEAVEVDEQKPVDVEAEADALEEHLESEDETQDAAEEETADEEKEEVSDKDDKESGEKPDEVEDWMKSDDEPDKEPEIDNNIARNIRLKATAKAERKSNAEIEELKSQIQRMQSGAQPQTHGLTMPNRDDYLDKDDPDAAFLIALSEYSGQKSIADVTATQQQAELKRQQDASKAAIEKNVDSHYEAAATLLSKSNISQDSYSAADLNVRTMVEGLYPEAGDALVDAFISKMGAGSERVMYNLGINKNRLAEFKQTLVNDPTGLDAAVFLGGLNAQLNKNVKRRSSAPPPAKHVQGDAKTSSSERALKKVYDAAEKKGDSQGAYNARKKARADGLDVSKW